jgi:hypothetical protein
LEQLRSASSSSFPTLAELDFVSAKNLRVQSSVMADQINQMQANMLPWYLSKIVSSSQAKAGLVCIFWQKTQTKRSLCVRKKFGANCGGHLARRFLFNLRLSQFRF